MLLNVYVNGNVNEKQLFSLRIKKRVKGVGSEDTSCVADAPFVLLKVDLRISFTRTLDIWPKEANSVRLKFRSFDDILDAAQSNISSWQLKSEYWLILCPFLETWLLAVGQTFCK